MYLEFFRFRKAPFHVTPDPEFLFLSSSHKEALAAIVYGVEQRKGFIAVTGEVGVGKTTILRSFLEDVDRHRMKVVCLFNANLSFPDLLRAVCRELSVDVAPDSVPETVERLHHRLIEEYREGRNVVLVLDEAQIAPLETLENLRLLSNLETSTDKLLQIVLVGQPELERMLARRELRQLSQRIAVRARIVPLTRSESLAYIEHRLSKVSLRGAPIFTRGAAERIAGRAGGIPRIINVLCDNALITAFGYQRRRVDRRVVREILTDYDGRAGRRWLRRGLTLAGLAAAAAAAVWFAIPGSVDTDGTRETAGTARMSVGAEPAGSVVTARPVARAAPAEISDPREHPAEKQDRPAESGDVAPDIGKSESSGSGPSGERGRDLGEPAKKPEPGRDKAGRSDIFASRVVRQGDYLSKLIIDVYGTYGPEALERVMRDNPSIRDPNLILEGMRIVFPKWSEAPTYRDERRSEGLP